MHGRNAYRDLYESLWKSNDDPASWRYRSRGVILGMLHQEKREAWELATTMCPGLGLELSRALMKIRLPAAIGNVPEPLPASETCIALSLSESPIPF